MLRQSRAILFFLLAVFLSQMSGAVNAQNLTYDPGLGTLPEAQGFTFTRGPGPLPSVQDGILHEGPALGGEYWEAYRTHNFDQGFVIEASLKVISSNYVPNVGTGQRFGYNFYTSDNVGRQVAVGIASNGIAINTDEGGVAGQGVPFTPFNTTGAFHHYKLDIRNRVIALYIDGKLFASTPVNGSTPSGALFPNRILFGADAGASRSETELRSFQAYVPLQYGITANVTSPTTAAISWTTTQTSGSTVEYGTTVQYGQMASDARLVTSHNVLLTNLSPGTLYHYRVSNASSEGGISPSGDFTFVTPSLPVTSGGNSQFRYTIQRQTDGSYRADCAWNYYNNGTNYQITYGPVYLTSAALGAALQPISPSRLPASIGPSFRPGDTLRFSILFPAAAGSPGARVVLHLGTQATDRFGPDYSYFDFRVILP